MATNRVIYQQMLVGILVFCFGQLGTVADKRALGVTDAVGTRRIARDVVHDEVAISPDGTHVAFIVDAPNVSGNSNNYELHLRSLEDPTRVDNGRVLIRADRLRGLRWLASSRKIAVISTEVKSQFEEDKLTIIDIASGKREIVESPTKRIRSFSADARGDRIALSVAVTRRADPAAHETQNRYGFRVSPGEPIIDPSLVENWYPDSYLYLVDSTADSGKKLTKLRPLGASGKPSDVFNGEVSDLSLSPDGRFLVFTYEAEKAPESWRNSFYVRQFESSAFALPLWGLLDLSTNAFRVAFAAPAYTYVPAIWSDDSRAFVVSALPPEGTRWETQDFAEGFSHIAQMDSFLHLFAVDARSGLVSEVLHRYTGLGGGYVAWPAGDGPMLVPLEGGVLARIKRTLGKWQEISRSTVFSDPIVAFQGITRNGELAIGVREDIRTPPALIVTNLKSGQNHALTDLNIEYRDISMGEVEKVSWTNKYGVGCWGYLIKPVGYTSGKQYPLVIMNKSREHFFVSDGSYSTAFPPQVLANDGFAVLMVQYSFDSRDLPTNFPGGLTEAYNWMAMVESGVDHLADQGIIDKTKVGIIGFSRTSWKTDFMLTHTDFRFAAASSADGGLYNYGVEWIQNDHGFMADAEAMFGGPPYGETRENWLKYAPAFNAQHVRCPLLMEYTGHGHLPYGPNNAFEFFTALYRQNKAVELYFYPLGDHPLDTPSERVASLQRNVDWFRFWIQDYEGKAPDYDPDQYARWRELRKLQEQNQGKVPTN